MHGVCVPGERPVVGVTEFGYLESVGVYLSTRCVNDERRCVEDDVPAGDSDRKRMLGDRIVWRGERSDVISPCPATVTRVAETPRKITVEAGGPREPKSASESRTMESDVCHGD